MGLRLLDRGNQVERPCETTNSKVNQLFEQLRGVAREDEGPRRFDPGIKNFKDVRHFSDGTIVAARSNDPDFRILSRTQSLDKGTSGVRFSVENGILMNVRLYTPDERYFDISLSKQVKDIQLQRIHEEVDFYLRCSLEARKKLKTR